MVATAAASQRAGCPSREELAAFVRGGLASEELERLAAHLGDCPSCEESLRSLHDASLAAGLRGPAALPDEPEYYRMQDAARALVPEAGAATVAEPPTTGGDDRAPTQPPPRLFGAYELLGEPMPGGMGVVWKARHRVLNVVRALKTLKAGADADPDAMTRFCVEGEAAARLDHPHIVRVHEFGQHDGQLFYTMEYLEGGTLARRLRARPLPPAEAAALVATLARAAHHAHANWIVHRDLKPSNVLFAADGTAKVADFGLAKLLEDGSLAQTQTHAVLGTAAYMAPEQAAGRAREAAPAMDVWALGAILYECLTGRAAFRGRRNAETLERVQWAEPERPSRLRPGLHPDLEAICLRCLEKDPAARYGSAAELADDLERWRDGLPTQARPLSRPKRVVRAVRRRPRAALALLLALLLLGGGVFAAFYRSPEARLRRIEDELARGRPVTLIGQTGPPAWFRVVTRPDVIQTAVDARGGFSVYSSGPALVELVRDPQRDHYRFRAEVRDGGGDFVESRMGIYVLHRAHAVPVGELHHWAGLTFSDNHDEKATHAAASPQGNMARLAPFVFAARPGIPFETQLPAGPRVYFKPDLGLDRGWRRLEVEVSPEGVRGRWEGQEMKLFSAASYLATSVLHRDLWLKEPGSVPFVQGFEPVFNPRGGLGLCVNWGAASFRNVVVEPLD
jgi:serine/threonine-protein kinase